ncbi:MAG TPA: hypothetical protein VGP08_24005 [Pyrinomonadaceae bacterium]|jgi:hypothetical protein|nr:hypothetical protein [Pyrinomonadaceae bacterium]
MEETKRTFADDEGEETMVSPRFDDEETVLARPVVPFEEVSDAPAAAAPTASTTAAPPPLYSRLRVAPRRSLVAALVLVSVLVGSVLGVAGLYFYQNHKSADAPATEQQQTEAPAAQSTTTETASESPNRETSAPAAQPSAPAAAEPDAEAGDDADTAKDKDSDEADASPVAERRDASEDREPAVTPKRGKKGARDEEIQRGSQRAPRYDEDSRPVVRDNDDDSADDRREARRVGVITYRPRRVRPRRDRYDTPDRLRRIFEGQP